MDPEFVNQAFSNSLSCDLVKDDELEALQKPSFELRYLKMSDLVSPLRNEEQNY